MFSKALWNYIGGYVIINVEGFKIERFLNISTKRGLTLRDIKLINEKAAILKLSIRDFKKLRIAAKKSKVKIKILKKIGFPLLVKNIFTKKGFIIGFVVFLLIFNCLASFIWQISVIGGSSELRSETRSKIEGIGIIPGVFKYNLNLEAIRDSLLVSNDNLAWVWVKVKGTLLTIEISEGKKPPEFKNIDIPVDIVAKKDGVIRTVDVERGIEIVKDGETVKKGQLLISGTVKSIQEDVQPMIVHATGKVIARTWYEASDFVPFIENIHRPTGKIQKCYEISLFEKVIPLHLLNKKLNYEEVKSDNFGVSIGKNFPLPFKLIEKTYYEYNIDKIKNTAEELKKKATDKVFKKVMKEIPQGALVYKTDLLYKIDHNGLTAKIIAECTEDIGTEKMIGGN